jgi:exosortase
MSTATIPPLSQWKRWVPTPPVMVAWGILLIAFVWNYWAVMFHTVHVWSTTPEMGHGFFVVPFALFLLWYRQEMVDPWPSQGTWWCIPFFVVFAVFRWLNLYLNYERDIDSLFPFLFGMTLVLGGWKAFRWAWPSIVFLFFMDPLPDRVAKAMGGFLQHGATLVTVYALQTLGIPAIVQGPGSNVIQLSSPPPLEVERACAGLSMLTLFFAVCIGACFVLREPLWKKIVLIVGAAPIAVICNVGRITVTGMLHEWISPKAGSIFHDWFGYLEMIPALLLIWGLLALLSALFIEPTTEGPLVFAEGVGISRRRTSPLGTDGMTPTGGVGPRGAAPSRTRQP